MTFLPSVTRAEYRGGFRIHLTFNDLSEGTVDFLPWLEGPVFEALKDPAYFCGFFVDGGAVAWPNGADIAPEALYEAATSGRVRRKARQRAAAKTGVKHGAARARH
ncbi:MAG: DUF2442 domain-containing protein [Terriglobia bacterium]